MTPLRDTSTPRPVADGSSLRGRLVSCWSVLRGCYHACWSFARTLSTDSAYEHYLDHHRRNHPERPALNRREFYLRQQSQKWSGVQRCC